MGARDPNDYLTRQTTDIIEKKKKKPNKQYITINV